ncbi:MAG: TraB/GumN family protein [Xanthomonadales bacterium]|nr:TraB/GumN family protein [Xanthomonadales bacterium]
MRATSPIGRFFCSLLMCLGLAAAISAQAQDQALFWAIESQGERAGYLLGTIHSEDPRVLEFTPEFLDALHGSSHFAMELVPDLPTLSRLAERMRLPQGQDLGSVIGQQRFDAIAGALGSYGVPRSEVARMQPWAAMMTLSVPPPKTGFFMDFSLSLRAAGQGLEVVGLETLDEQLGFLENMSLAQQLSMLDQALAESGQVQQVHDRMVDIYLTGELAALEAETEGQLTALDEDVRDWFMAEGIVARNHRMFERIVDHLGQGHGVFVAVGALHLPGAEGLLALLRQAGYRLIPLASPFPGAAGSGQATVSG